MTGKRTEFNERLIQTPRELPEGRLIASARSSANWRRG
jgi:hypothetical protein